MLPADFATVLITIYPPVFFINILLKTVLADRRLTRARYISVKFALGKNNAGHFAYKR